MIAVISVGGSVIAPTLNAEKFIAHAEVIKEVAKGSTVLVVTGWKGRARLHRGARSMGTNKSVCDLIGISLSHGTYIARLL